MKCSKYLVFKFTFLISFLPSLVISQGDNWIRHNNIGTSVKDDPTSDFHQPTFYFTIGSKGYAGIVSETVDVTWMYEYDVTTNNWTQKASLPGKLRRDACWFSIGSKGYVCGGWNYPNYYKDFWEYDPLSDSWARKADFPAGIINASGFSISDKGYVVLGAKAISNSVFNTVSTELWQYDPAENQWTQKASFAGFFRNDQVSFTLNNQAYIGLGYHTGNSNQPVFDHDIWVYNPVNNSWIQKANYPGPDRYSRMGVGINGKAYVGTGEQPYGFPASSNEFWQFDPVTNQWQKKKDFFDDARRAPANFVINNKLYVGLGYGRVSNPTTYGAGVGQPNDLWLYNETNDTWLAKRALQYSDARCSFEAGGKAFVLVNNYDYKVHLSRLALFAFDTTTKTWTRKSDFPSTDILWGMGSFTIGNKGYIIGGNNSEIKVSYKNFYEYDPASDKWSRKADFGGEGRGNFSAFTINGKGYAGLGFVRKEVNGLSSAYKVNDFWEYNPQLDSWTKKLDLPTAGFSQFKEICSFSTAAKGYVLVNDGTNNVNNPYVNHVYEFEPSANTWTQKKDFPGRSRSLALGLSIRNKGYVFGGSDNVPIDGNYIGLSDVWEYSADNDSWNLHVNFLGYERSPDIGCAIGNKIYNGGNYDWWEYKPAAARTQYVFNGTGNYSDFNNWIGSVTPPFDLTNGTEIIINPPLNGECRLDVLQVVSSGSRIIVAPKCKLIVQDKLVIQ